MVIKLHPITVIHTNGKELKVYINLFQIVSLFEEEGRYFLAMTVRPTKEITQHSFNALYNLGGLGQ